MQTQATDKLWHIKQCPLFSALTEDEMQAINSAAQLVQVGKTKVVPPPPEGEPSLFVIKRGHVQLTYSDGDGNEAVVIVLGPGDVFGSLENDETAFGEHCKALADVCLCRINRPRFEDLLQKYPSLAFRLTKFSMLRIRRLEVRLAEMMMKQADERLALALLDLDQQVGKDDEKGRRKLNLTLTHADLAKLIGTSREMVTMIMGKFRKNGHLDTEKGWIYIKNIDGLRSVVGRD
jgi:CRP/FNR family transcriptional regulator, cyclic AMP receptor protein